MFTRHRLRPANKLDCPHAMGTNAFSPQRAESFRHFLLLPSPHSTPSLRSVPQGRLRLFTTDASRRIFESALERVRRSFRLHIYGYVVTPEHVRSLRSRGGRMRPPLRGFRHYATGCEGRVEIESEWTARKRERAAGRLFPAGEMPPPNQKPAFGGHPSPRGGGLHEG